MGYPHPALIMVRELQAIIDNLAGTNEHLLLTESDINFLTNMLAIVKPKDFERVLASQDEVFFERLKSKIEIIGEQVGKNTSIFDKLNELKAIVAVGGTYV